MIAILDYGIRSLENLALLLERLGASEVRVTTNAADAALASAIVLPGSGDFPHCARAFERLGLAGTIRDAHDRGVPILGIAAGMQLLFEGSADAALRAPAPLPLGLAFFHGTVTRAPAYGWRELHLARPHPWLADVTDGERAYFDDAYAAEVEDESIVLATAGELVAAVGDGGVLGVQFQPEMSGRLGERVLAAFARAARA